MTPEGAATVLEVGVVLLMAYVIGWSILDWWRR
jgi:hypothetical protein